MPRFIGENNPYGLFRKVNLTPNDVSSIFSLPFQVPDENSVLVVYGGSVQEPGVDYSLTNGGNRIVFSFVPSSSLSLYLVYLGQHFSVPVTLGNRPFYETFVGDGSVGPYPIAVTAPLYEASILVHKDSVLQRINVDYTLDNTTNEITFTDPVLVTENIDVYVFGLARNDVFTVDDGTITKEKLNLEWEFDAADNFYPKDDNLRDLGLSTKRIKKSYINDADFAGDVLIQGNFEVQGTTTSINTQDLNIDDNSIILNSNFTTGSPSINGGIELLRGSSNSAKIEFDEIADVWKAGIDGSLDTIVLETDFDNHVTNTSNPHSVTKTQVGLSDVTNDAQLKRAANDYAAFTDKVSPTGSDYILIEDAADSNNKKRVAISNLPFGSGTYDNDVFLQWRNAADDADLDILKLNSSDEVVLQAEENTNLIRFNLKPSVPVPARDLVFEYDGSTFINITSSSSIKIDGTTILTLTGGTINKSILELGTNIVANASASGTIRLQGSQNHELVTIRKGGGQPVWLFNVDSIKYMTFTTTAKILSNTTDANDTRKLSISGGGDSTYTRGAFIDFCGNEFASTPGDLILTAGDTGDIYFQTGAEVKRWYIDQTGDFIPFVDSTYNLGSSSNHVNTLYVDNIVGVSLGGGETVNEETGTSVTATANESYICNNASLVTVTLPSTISVGDKIRVIAKGSGGFKIAQNSGQTIHFGNSSTTTGTSGDISSTNQYDVVELMCITADTDFVAISSVGNLQIT